MNRVIKFRAWDKTEKRFIDDPFWVSEGKVMINNYFAEDDYAPPEYPDAEIMQFTGLLDKNGKEVYEGDLLRVWIQGDEQSSPYEIESMCEFYLQLNHADSYYRFGPIEVIGNVWENPELI